MRFVRGIAGVIGVLGVAACSLLTSTDGLSGGPDDGGGAADSRGDGPTGSDGGPGGGDGGGPTDAATFSCKGVDAQLCTTFDENPLTFDWTSKAVKPPTGTLRLDDAAASSPPLSFFAQAAAIAGDTDLELGRDFAPTKATTSFDVAFDVLIDQIGDGTWYLSSIQFGNIGTTAQRYDMDFEIKVTGTDVQAAILETYPNGSSRSAKRGYLLRYPIQGKWTHVEQRVSFVTNTYEVTLDGTTVLAANPLAPVPASRDASFRLGIYTGSKTPAVAVHYDNVVAAVH